MSTVSLPKNLRPSGYYKKCALGVDLPAWFIRGLQGIDPDIYPIWHEYRLAWEPIVINQYDGNIGDYRYAINTKYGHMNFGRVMNFEDGPMKDQQWHIWRLSWPYGWEHITNLEYKEPEYLKLVLRRLGVQARIVNRYGMKRYNRDREEVNKTRREKMQKDQEYLLDCFNEENAWLFKKASENMERGIVSAPSPTIDKISSYSGQTNRTKIVRDVTDKEGGLYVPE